MKYLAGGAVYVFLNVIFPQEKLSRERAIKLCMLQLLAAYKLLQKLNVFYLHGTLDNFAIDEMFTFPTKVLLRLYNCIVF